MPTTPATALAAPETAPLTASVTPAAVPDTEATSSKMAFTLARDSLAESRAVLAFSTRAGTSLTAGWSSSTMPSSLATIGCVWAMTSFAVDVTSSMDLRAPRTVSATSMTAQIPTSARTTSAMSR